KVGRPSSPPTEHIELPKLLARIGATSVMAPPKLPLIPCQRGKRDDLILRPQEGVLEELVRLLLEQKPPLLGRACRLVSLCGHSDRVNVLEQLLQALNEDRKRTLPRANEADRELLRACLVSTTAWLGTRRDWNRLVQLLGVCRSRQLEVVF